MATQNNVKQQKSETMELYICNKCFNKLKEIEILQKGDVLRDNLTNNGSVLQRLSRNNGNQK